MIKLSLILPFLIFGSCFGMENPEPCDDTWRLDPYVSRLPDLSFNLLYWYMQHKRMDKFENELKKKKAKEGSLTMLLYSAILTRDKAAFKLLTKYGARLIKIDLKTLSMIPKDFFG